MLETTRVAGRYNLSPYLPKESIERTPDVKQWPHWEKFLHCLCDEVDEDNKFNETLRQRKWLQVIRYYEGQQGGFVDQAGQWQTVSRKPGDAIHVSNIFQYFVNILIKESLRSSGKLQTKARGNKFALEFGARLYSEVFGALQETIWTATERNRDTRNVILTGNSFIRTFKANDYERSKKVPIYAQKQQQLGDGVFTCTKCDNLGAESDLMSSGGNCPYCAAPSDAVSIRRAASFEYPEITGYQDCPGAKIDSRGISPFSVKLDSTANDLASSQHLRISMLCDDEVLRAHYPWAIIGDGAENNLALRMQRQAQQSPGNYDGQGTPTMLTLARGRSVHNEYYLEPSKYVNYEWPTDEIMADGSKIRKGTRAIDLYPKGMKIIRSSGTILVIESAVKNKEFSHWAWDMTTEGPYGLGVEHMVESNTSRNELMSLAKGMAMHQAAFSLIVNQKKIRRSSLLGKPGHIAVMEKPGPNDNPGNFIHQPVLKDMSSGVTNLLEQQKRDMEMESGGTLALDTMPASETLGAMQIRRDSAVSALIPRLVNRDARDIELAYQWAEHLAADKEMAAEYYKEISDFHEYEIKSFMAIDPRRHLQITIAEGSNVPRSELERRQMALEPLTIGGLPGGIFALGPDGKPLFPEAVKRRVLETSGLPLDTDEYQVDERIQRIEIMDILNAAQSIEVVDEAILEEFRLQFPVRFKEDNHSTHQLTIIKFLKTDIGRRLPNNLRALLLDHMQMHEDAQQHIAMQAQALAGQQAAAGQAMMSQEKTPAQ